MRITIHKYKEMSSLIFKLKLTKTYDKVYFKGGIAMSEVEKCSWCGKRFTGIFKVKHITEEGIEKFKKIGVDASLLCFDCATIIHEKRQNEIKNKIKEKKEELVHNVLAFTTPFPPSWDAKIHGIVSGYSVIGTGPIVNLASTCTDFLGKESLAYLEKIRKGENNALYMAKYETLKKGGNAIAGCSLSITEASAGHGMLMISCVGTAISYGKRTNNLSHLNELVEALENSKFVLYEES